jgi:hypothetical protein
MNDSLLSLSVTNWLRLALVLVLFAGPIGCGGDTPPLGFVTGTVTLDGKPVDGATIQFEPTTPGSPTSFGRTDSQGKYELWYSRGNKGATLGESIIRITAFQDASEDSGQKKRPEIVPAKYNASSELKVEVKRGTQVHDFALQAGGPIIQPDAAPTASSPQRRNPVTGCN